MEHESSHTHVHDPKVKRREINRIARIIGHLEYVKRMLEADEDCSEVLIQLSAVRSALNGLGKQIINEHLEHCIHHAIEEGDVKAVEDFQAAIEKYL
ncbi:MAG: metal-sensing transcriptional repressor [Lachnospiraceae bacterium]|nr:metal-sensing transcriptional repressor [Lachnospiraceae bacterium]